MNTFLSFRYHVLLALLFLFSERISAQGPAPSTNKNYVVEHTVKVPGITNVIELSTKDVNQVNRTIQYFDGLGRPEQSIGFSGSPLGNDIVQPIVYDAYGRETKKYLPYVNNATTGAFNINPVNSGDALVDYHTSPQYQFYESLYSATPQNPEYPYAETKFESSPLNRALEQGAPGAVWQVGSGPASPAGGNTVGFEYATNDTDEVLLWLTDTDGTIYLDASSMALYFDTNELYKNTTTDEEGNRMIEYTDKLGRVVLKKAQLANIADSKSHTGWACTYYVYDDFGDLRAVLPPELVKEITATTPVANYIVPATDMDMFGFQYQYDGRRRMTIKKVPGAEPVYLVYDKRDRLVLTQDGNQRSTAYGGNTGREWTFTKYDALNRPVITGVYTHNSVLDQGQMQAYVNGQIVSGNDFYEELDESAGNHGYSNRMFPDSDIDVLSVTYYDNYNFKGQSYFDEENLSFDYNNSVNTTLQPTVENNAIKGQVTGSKVKALDPAGGVLYLNTVIYYDDRYRMIQSITENHLGGTETSTVCYDDLTANVKESYTTSSTPNTPPVHRRFSYDHAQRLDYIEHSIDGGSFVKIIENQYNELGELIKKDLHGEGGNAAWQSVDYQYNIRGWLTHINDANLSDANDLFGMELYYADGFDVPAYNGNISGVKWKSAMDEDRMAYGYTYDKLNRIRTAHYVAGTSGLWKNEGFYNMEILGAHISGDDYESGYDLNGNIESLKRYGVVDNHQAAIDVLSYDYTGNQLNKVDDDGTDEGFKDGTIDPNGDGNDYLYDANGNMIVDDNKGIENIEYNLLNLPMVIHMTENRKIEYVYDAAGVKLAQRVYEDDTQPAGKTTDYVGERIYETKGEEARVLQFFHHEEGRVVPAPVAGPVEWKYQYHLKDHLGNTRLTFGAPETKTYLLTMEIDPVENRVIETDDFENVYESEFNLIPALNHTAVTTSTPNPEYVAWLNGIDRVIGPAKSLKVLPGDVVEIEAWAKYLHLETYDPTIPADLLLGGFFGAFLGAGSEMLVGNGYVDEGLLSGLTNIANNGLDYDGVPRAYINYILFDKNYQMIEGKKLQISQTGKFEIGDTDLGLHEYLQIDPITISKEGFVYIYLSNQTPGSDVYFDDLMITHTQSSVIQKDDYYPFGLSIAGLNSSRENALANNFLYNGKELQTDLGLDWYDYGARMYDAAIGRWHVVDPLADIPKQIGMSPYSAFANNPIYYIDPDGRCFTKAENGDYVPCDEGSSGDTRTGAFGNNWTYGEDSWQLTNTNENPDYSKANQVTPTGELNYYERRYQNHINEYGTKPPDYYLEYGYNYAKKFSKDLRSDPEISDDLRKWIDETVVSLQVFMETGIQESTNSSSDNFGMQGNNKKFRAFAFDTHVPAYTNSGTLKTLSAAELFKIFNQVRYKDMRKRDGIKQAIDIVPKLFE